MKKTAILLSLCAGTALAAPLRVDLAGKPVTAETEVVQGDDGIARVTSVSSAVLELYPQTNLPARGTILVFPGGGYSILAIEHEGRAVAQMLNGCGYDAAVLLYHVAQGDATRKLALADAMKAANLVRTDAKKLGVSDRSLGALGFSAGGHLAARLSHELSGSRPLDLLALIYPAYLETSGKLNDEVIPANIPTFVCAAEDDPYFPSSRALADYAKTAGLKLYTRFPATGGHGFGLSPTRAPTVMDWPSALYDFFIHLPATKAATKETP